MKSILVSIQPYWVFLIIAKTMGWNVEKEKMVEVRKNFPKDADWDKTVKIYCSTDKKSFSKIPQEYQPLMGKFFGRVVGEFVCDKIVPIRVFENGTIQDYLFHNIERSCVPYEELAAYIGKCKTGYEWHISDLVIYDKPRELSEFYRECEESECDDCPYLHFENTPNSYEGWCEFNEKIPIKRPPQSWCYVEEVRNA